MFVIRNSPFDPLKVENEHFEDIIKMGHGRLIDKSDIFKILSDCALL
jgi:hypothetical protein